MAEEGFLEADLDQIGTLNEAPIDEPHASAYQGALEGEVAIIRFVEFHDTGRLPSRDYRIGVAQSVPYGASATPAFRPPRRGRRFHPGRGRSRP